MRNLLILVMVLFTTSLAASQIHWAKDYKSGIEQAKIQKKPVLFVSSRHTCKYCVILDKTTFQDKKVIKALNRDFVSIISYSDEQDYMPRDLWRPGTPALWFLKSDGEPMYQPLMGAIDAPNFLNALGIIKAEFDTQAKKKGK